MELEASDTGHLEHCFLATAVYYSGTGSTVHTDVIPCDSGGSASEIESAEKGDIIKGYVFSGKLDFGAESISMAV